MDRATRFIANRKQDKIRVVREQPSIQSMREGEEVLYFRNRGTLTRYRKNVVRFGLLICTAVKTNTKRASLLLIIYK